MTNWNLSTKLGLLLVLALTCGSVRAANWSYVPGVNPMVKMTGLITAGDAQRLSSTIRQHAIPAGTRFHLESRGGDVDESMEVGKLLRRHRAVVTHGYCASSCVFEFVGGSKRYMSKTASGRRSNGLVVHQPSATATLIRSPNSAIKAKFKVLEDYLTEMTRNPQFYQVMVGIPFDAPVALTAKDAFELGVIHGVY